jgi:hypothetical protein
MRRVAALSFGVLVVSAVAAACSASGSDAEVHGPVFGFDAGSDAPGAGGDAARAPSDAASGGDASSAPDVAAPGDSSSSEGDAGVGSDASPAPGDDASSFDASALCAVFDAATNPFVGVTAAAGGTTIADNGTVPASQPVVIRAWTTPVDVMQIVNVAYTTNAFATPALLAPLSLAPADAGAPAGEQEWSGSIPGLPSGTSVAWYVVGTDVCSSVPQYYSNLNANYHYTVP